MRVIVTGNAAVNAPMIAVNDMMGFEVASEGIFWQKHLSPLTEVVVSIGRRSMSSGHSNA